MLNRFLKRTKCKKGFTLVELIVVIAIIGILAGMMLPRFGNFTDDARLARSESDAKALSNMVAIYQARHGNYPDVSTATTTELSLAGTTLTFTDREASSVGTMTLNDVSGLQTDSAALDSTADRTYTTINYTQNTSTTISINVKTGVVTVTETP